MLNAKVAPAAESTSDASGLRTCATGLGTVMRDLGRLSPQLEPVVWRYGRHRERCRAVFEAQSHEGVADAACVSVYEAHETAQRVAKGQVKEADHQELVDASLVLDAAERSVKAVHDSVESHLEQRRGYTAMVKYLVTTSLLLIVVVAQRGFGSDRTDMYQAIQGEMFGVTTTVTFGGVEVQSRITAYDAILDWIETRILDTIFVDEVCGDGVCTAPDEAPFFHASDEARVFSSCEADCGSVATRKVRVDFVDPWKLWYATKHMEMAVKYGWAGRDASRWNAADRLPDAGWNLCAVNKTEYGTFVDVCIFDGDFEIDGNWYRNSELNINSSNFGKSYELDLFDATWELRIAYVNFSWPSLGDGTVPPQAFPAVRGEICFEDAATGAFTQECTSWAPCPDSTDCKCNFYETEYVCFDDQGTWNSWDSSYVDFGSSMSTQWLGRWWGINVSDVATLDDLRDANVSNLDDDLWHLFSGTCGETYYLYLVDSFDDGGWNTARLTITDLATGEEVVSDAYVPEDESWAYYELRMCPTGTYAITVTPDCDLNGAGGVFWELNRASTSTWTSGEDCIDSCDPFNTTSCTRDCSAFSSCTWYTRRRLAADDDASTAVPTTYPTSLSNVFDEDLREVATDNRHFFLSLDACSPASIGDSVCDANNDNAACGWDGGDCCVQTCVPSAAPGCQSLTPADCTSPFELGLDYENCFTTPSDDDAHYGDDDDGAECAPLWPYYVQMTSATEDEIEYHVKQPFTTYEALRSVLAVRDGYVEYAHSKMPSTACGDCATLAHLAQPYQSFRFNVTIESTSTIGMFPHIENLQRERYYVRPNLVLVGPMLTTKRYKRTRCDAVDDVVENSGATETVDKVQTDDDVASCQKDSKPQTPWTMGRERRRRFKANRYDKSPFGTDATFMTASSVYRPTNEIGDFYDTETDVNQWGLPFGFEYRQGSTSSSVQGFPVVFDVNLNVSRYREVLEHVRQGSYIDLRTRQLNFQLALLNAETAYLALVVAKATKLDGGGFGLSTQVNIVDAALYDATTDYYRLAFEIMYLAALVYCLVREAMELDKNYIRDWKNWIDLASFAAQCTLVGGWIAHARACAAVEVPLHAAVYEDFFAVGRILYAGPGLDAVFDLYSDLHALVASNDFYQTVVACTILLSMLQFLKTLHFHPRLGITTSTIFLAGQDLLFFAFLFLFILVMYAVLGLVLFGESLEGFETLGFAFMSLIDINFGEFGSTSAAKTSGNAFIVIFFYSFLIISSLILLNALLAIIVDAYSAVKDAARSTQREVLGVLALQLVGVTTPPKKFYVKSDTLLEAFHKGPSQFDLKDEMPETQPDAPSSKVLLVHLDDVASCVCFDQSMLREVIKLAAMDDEKRQGAPPPDHLDVICYNILEQHGVPLDLNTDNAAELQALARHRELQVYRRFFTTTPLTLAAVALLCSQFCRDDAAAGAPPERPPPSTPAEENEPTTTPIEPCATIKEGPPS